jgi:predicted MFS family arabinose efflux permease
VSNLIVAHAGNLEVLLLGRILLGVGVGGLWTFAVAAARRLVPEASGGKATALVSAAISVGTVAGVPAGAAIGDAFGWRSAFLAMAIFGFLVLALQMFLLPALPAQRAIGLRQLGALFRIPKARVGLAAILFIAAGHFAAYTYLEPFLRYGPHLSQNVLTAALAGYGLAGLAGAFLGEAVAAKSVRLAFVGATLILGAALLLAAVFGQDAITAVVIVLVWGCAFGAVPVTVQIWMYQASPDAYEGGSALFVAVFQIAIAIGAFVGGVVFDASGIAGALTAGGLLALGSSLILAVFGRDRAPIKT